MAAHFPRLGDRIYSSRFASQAWPSQDQIVSAISPRPDANADLIGELPTLQIAEAAEAVGLFYPPVPGSMMISTIDGHVAESSGLRR